MIHNVLTSSSGDLSNLIDFTFKSSIDVLHVLKFSIINVMISRLARQLLSPLRCSYLVYTRLASGGVQIKPKKRVSMQRGDQERVLTESALSELEASESVEDTEEEMDRASYEREFVDHTVEDFAELYANDDPSGSTKFLIETILNEYEYLKYNSMGKVPSKIDLVDMQQLMEEGTVSTTREKIFLYQFKREMNRLSASNKKRRDALERQLLREARSKELDEKYGGNRTGLLTPDNKLIYGLWHNSLFTRIPDSVLRSSQSGSRLRQAALYGTKLVFDFGFEEFMAPWLYRNVIDQVQEAYGLNKFDYREPFDFWFCNFKADSFAAKYASEKAIKNVYNGSMITVKEDCFTNHFDKSRLVYLSPDSREQLTDIGRNDDVYIVGVYNDRGASKPISFRKAEALGIRCKSLPLDSYLAWQGGSKCLCVNHVVGVLLDVMSNGGDWREALNKHIPKRKIKPIEVLIEEQKRRNEKDKLRKRSRKFSIRDDLF